MKIVCVTCAQSEASLFAHVAQTDRDAVSSSRLQAFQQIFHCVVLCGQLVILLLLTDHIPHMDCIGLQKHGTNTH